MFSIDRKKNRAKKLGKSSSWNIGTKHSANIVQQIKLSLHKPQLKLFSSFRFESKIFFSIIFHKILSWFCSNHKMCANIKKKAAKKRVRKTCESFQLITINYFYFLEYKKSMHNNFCWLKKRLTHCFFFNFSLSIKITKIFLSVLIQNDKLTSNLHLLC